MLVLIVNILNISILLSIIVYLLKRRIDSSILWYCIVSVYFINLPLCVDSVFIIFTDRNSWENILVQNNLFWEYSFLSHLKSVSVQSIIFNCILLFTYFLLFPIKDKYKFHSINSNTSFFPWWTYFLFSYGGLVLFMYTNQIFSLVSIAGTGEWYRNRVDNRLLILITNLCVTISPIVLLRILHEKRYIIGIITLLPIFIIGYITQSRTQIISIAFYFLYYFIWKQQRMKLIPFLKIIGLGFGITILLSIYRDNNASFYPIVRDVSYTDLFYSFAHINSLFTYGEDTIRLILTGFYSYQVEDIPTKLADYKFFQGWGTLHPTLLGWAYIDLKSSCFLLALYIGFFMALCDKLRHSLPFKYNLLYLAFIFVFIAVAVRGSVQVAYANLIYPTFIFLLVSIYLHKKKNENYRHS